MKINKKIATLVLCLVTFHAQALDLSKAFHQIGVLVGLADKTEIIDTVVYTVIASPRANGMLQNRRNNICNKKIEYKFFKTPQETITSSHLTDGSTFTANEKHYVVRSGLFNSDTKIYATTKTLLNKIRIVITSDEAKAIMNDANSLTSIQMTLKNFSIKVGNKIIRGTIADESTFTADSINYIVRYSGN